MQKKAAELTFHLPLYPLNDTPDSKISSGTDNLRSTWRKYRWDEQILSLSFSETYLCYLIVPRYYIFDKDGISNVYFYPFL